MLTSVWRRGRVTILASLLALSLLAMAGFSTTAGAATPTRPYAPTGASGIGVDAPPKGSEPLNAKVWDAKNYRIVHHAESCPQPPQSVAARLALMNSPVTLTYYGLAMLATVRDQAEWTTIVTHMQTRVCDTTTPIKNGKPITNGTTPSNLWGGYGALQCSYCWQFKAANFNFTVQSIEAALSSDVSVWVGVGGATSSSQPLVQAGVSSDSTNFSISNHAFYEYVPPGGGSSVENDAYSVSSGDSMYFYANTGGQTYLDDYTSGKYYNYIDGYASTDSAEFIVERNGGCDPFSGCVELAHYYTSYTPSGAQYETTDNTWHNLDSSAETFWQWNLYNRLPPGYQLETQGLFGSNGSGSSWFETYQHGS